MKKDEKDKPVLLVEHTHKRGPAPHKAVAEVGLGEVVAASRGGEERREVDGAPESVELHAVLGVGCGRPRPHTPAGRVRCKETLLSVSRGRERLSSETKKKWERP